MVATETRVPADMLPAVLAWVRAMLDQAQREQPRDPIGYVHDALLDLELAVKASE